MASATPSEPTAVAAGPQLGGREVQIALAWVFHGTKAHAAQELFIAHSTVKTVIQRVRDKYRAVGRPAPTQVALLIRFLQDGIIDLDVLLRVGPGAAALEQHK